MLVRGLLAMAFMAVCGPVWAQQNIDWYKSLPKGCKVGWVKGAPVEGPVVDITWNGPCPKGIAHGRGTFEILEQLSDRRRAWTGEGDFVNGLLNGGAFFVNQVNGRERAEGHFRDGQLNGRGVITTLGGKYDGEFVDGKLNGWGVFEQEDTNKKGRKSTWHYEGEWQNGERTGRGIEVIAVSGCSAQWRYEGEFRNGHYNGRGTLKAADGRTYSGVWQKGELGNVGTRLHFDDPNYKLLPTVQNVCGF